MATDYPPPEPCKPVLAYEYQAIPDFMMQACLAASDAGEGQILAIMQSLVRQTVEALETQPRVSWPKFGTWRKATYNRADYTIREFYGLPPMEPGTFYAFRCWSRWTI